MNFTQFHQIFRHQVLFHCKEPNGTRYTNTENTTLDRGFMAKQFHADNAKFSVKTRLDNDFPIELTYFQ